MGAVNESGLRALKSIDSYNTLNDGTPYPLH